MFLAQQWPRQKRKICSGSTVGSLFTKIVGFMFKYLARILRSRSSSRSDSSATER